MKFKIRKGTEKDLVQITELAVEMVVYSISPYRDSSCEGARKFRREDLEVLKEAIKMPNIGIFIAEDESGNFLGHLIVVGSDVEASTGERQGWIFDVSVKEECWNLGIGTELMRCAEEFTRNLGLKYIGLGVTSSNERAVTFYERLGYREERKRMIKRLDRQGNAMLTPTEEK